VHLTGQVARTQCVEQPVKQRAGSMDQRTAFEEC
jgi:hypothetical protein